MSKRPLYIDLALYGLAALFAGATALWSTLAPHENWGAIAIGGYAPAAFVAVMLLSQISASWFARALAAAATAVAVVVIPLVAQAFERASGVDGRAQEEVLVVEASGRRLLETGSPYLGAETIATQSDPLLAYNPYQPGMAVFGLPAALFGQHWWTDARLYFLLVAAVCLAWAFTMLRGQSEFMDGQAPWRDEKSIRNWSRRGAGKGLLLRAFQASILVPVCALTFATGGDDMPVAALAVLALVFAFRDRWLAAGLAIGAAGALKLFAWPVAAVLLLMVWRGSAGGPAIRRYLIGFAAPVAVVMAPVLAFDPRGLFDNVVAFGLGHGVIESPARSPLPGFLIAEHVPAGDIIAPGLLGVAALAVAALLWVRPPLTAASAALWSAGGLSTAFMLMPATRFGYLLYPVILVGWWLPLRDAAAVTPEDSGDETDAANHGPSLTVEWWR